MGTLNNSESVNSIDDKDDESPPKMKRNRIRTSKSFLNTVLTTVKNGSNSLWAKLKSLSSESSVDNSLLEEFELDMYSGHKRRFLAFSKITILSIMLYSNVLLIVSISTLLFVGSLPVVEHTKGLFIATIIAVSIYLVTIFLMWCNSFAYKVNFDVQQEVLDRRSIGDDKKLRKNIPFEKILANQFKQISYIVPLALAWLALIGLKM